MHVRCTLTLIAALATSTAAAQIPETFDNLQVLPADVPRAELVQRMREFSFALGVRCEHCHTEQAEGVVNRYASDARPAKTQARAMLRMVSAINGTLLAQLPSRATPTVRVDCVTCHRGLALPKTLQTTLFEVATSAGGPAAVTRYRELRKSDMGSGRYNFGQWEINELARRLTQAGNIDAAMAMLEVNAEFYPASAEIDVLIGELHRTRGETEKALGRYRAALGKDPQHLMAKRRLQELEAKIR